MSSGDEGAEGKDGNVQPALAFKTNACAITTPGSPSAPLVASAERNDSHDNDAEIIQKSPKWSENDPKRCKNDPKSATTVSVARGPWLVSITVMFTTDRMCRALTRICSLPDHS